MTSILANTSNDFRNLSQDSKMVYRNLLLSPCLLWRCFTLLYQTKARSRKAALFYRIMLILILIFLGVWCYMLWLVTFDLGYYLTLLSDVSSTTLTIDEGRQRFDDLFWRTIIKTIFISISYGLIQGCNCIIASIWRERLCDQFHSLLFKSPNGCSLYEISQKSNVDISNSLTNDIRQFTTHMGLCLFGSLYYGGIINLTAVIILFCIYVVRSTGGDSNGILISFGAFAFCLIFIVLLSGKFNSIVAQQSTIKGRLRAFLQRLLTNAESIVFYSSQRCELKFLMKIIESVHKINLRVSYWYGIISLPIVLLNSISSLILYLLPAVLFFFLQSPSSQTPDAAKNYLGIIGFYGYIFFNLVSLIWISESCLICVTMGKRLSHIKTSLIKLNKYHKNRLIDEERLGLRRSTNHFFELASLSIYVPYKEILLQSNLSLRITRQQCLFISGKTGCGKTSLMRICAGLWPLKAEYISIPDRKNLIFIPQRPYLPIGSLRFQAELLLTNNLTNENIHYLFKLVNMDYISERYNLDEVIDWSCCLSIGEQQRLSFVRLFALFIYSNVETTNKLVFLDESTSAIDTNTEAIIYQTMLGLNIWFITISHRPSLKSYHSKELKLDHGSEENIETNHFQPNEENLHLIETDTNNHTSVLVQDNSTATEIKLQQNSGCSWFTSLIKMWHLTHLPFDTKQHKTLRIQTYVAWLCCFICMGIYSYLSYRLASQTGSIFSVLSDYIANKTDVQTAKQQLRSEIPLLVLQMVGYTIFYSCQIGCGQIIGSLYVKRQLTYLSQLVLGHHDSSLYPISNTLDQLSNILSHELVEFNTHLFYLLFGSIYFNGILGVLVLCIPYTRLLALQPNGLMNIAIIYLSQVIFTCFILIALLPFYRANQQWEKSFTGFTNAQKRLDLQAEQIVLSDQSLLDVEERYVKSKLDLSINDQQYAGYFYGLLVAISVFGNWAATIIVYCIPSVIYFHITKNTDVAQISAILTMSVYNGYLNNTLTTINSYGQSIAQLWTMGLRIINNFEELKTIIAIHRRQQAEELDNKKRTWIQSPLDHVLKLNNIDIHYYSNNDLQNILIHSLTFTLNTKSSLLISGPSGCGKSSLLRLMAALQYNTSSNSDSYIEFLSSDSTIFLPQKLHLIDGTLRQQLSYLSQSKGFDTLIEDDIQIRNILHVVNLEYLIDRHTLDSSEYTWSCILSIGEQQRLMIASALLVLNTKMIQCFIFDEVTAGCDEETERQIYSYLQHLDISYISVSHRHRLVDYHTHQLIIDLTNKSYQFLPILFT